MVANKNNAVFGGFTRLRDFPLDTSSVFSTEGALRDYITKTDVRPTTAYSGQIVSVLENKSIYLINEPKTPENTFEQAYTKICDYSDLDSFSSSIQNMKIQIESEIENFRTEIATLSTKEALDRLLERFSTLESSVSTQVAEIENGLEERLGSFTQSTVSEFVHEFVAQEIAKVVGGAPETFDTLKEIADVLNEDENAAASILTTIGNLGSRVAALENAGIDEEGVNSLIDAKLENYDFSNFATTEYTETELEKLRVVIENANIGQDMAVSNEINNTSTEKDIENNVTIKQIKIIFYKKAADYVKSTIPTFNLAYLYNKTQEEIEEVFVTSEEVDHEAIADAIQLPATFEYNISYKIPNDENEYSLKVDLYKFFDFDENDPVEDVGVVNITYA